MKKLLFNGKYITFGSGYNWIGASDKHFRMVVKTNIADTLDADFAIPTVGIDLYDFQIEWGDGIVETYTGLTPTVQHTYGVPGTYDVSIRGVFPRVYFGADWTNARKVIAIKNYGDVGWTNMLGSFRYTMANNGTQYAKGYSNFSGIDNFTDTFNSCRFLNDIDVSSWDMSSAKQLVRTFYRCGDINQVRKKIIGFENWDVSNVINMQSLFASCGCNDYSGIANWNTDSLTYMYGMFSYNNYSDYYPIENWNVSKVTNMADLFSYNTTLTNENYEAILISWASQTLKNTVSVNFGSAIPQTQEAIDAKQYIIDTYNWTIVDGLT